MGDIINIAGPSTGQSFGERVPGGRVTGTGTVDPFTQGKFIIGAVVGFKTALQDAGLDAMLDQTRPASDVGTDMDIAVLSPARHVEMRTGWAAIVTGIISGDGGAGSRLSLLYRGFTDALVGSSSIVRGTTSTLFGPLYVRFSTFGLDMFPLPSDNAVRVGMFYDTRPLVVAVNMGGIAGQNEGVRAVYFNGQGGF